MRKIDWEKPLSDEDIAWLRQSGMPGIEERIERHQAAHGEDIPEAEVPEDTVTRSAFDSSPTRGRLVSDAASAPINVTPDLTADATDEPDDYDSWKVSELKEEVEARNRLAETQENVSEVQVEGTGKEGAVTKADLVKGLRLWDQDNPGALGD